MTILSAVVFHFLYLDICIYNKMCCFFKYTLDFPTLGKTNITSRYYIKWKYKSCFWVTML